MLEVSCRELNVEGCDFVATRNTADEVLQIAVEHLRDEHGFDLQLEDLQYPDEVDGDAERMLLHRLRNLVLTQL